MTAFYDPSRHDELIAAQHRIHEKTLTLTHLIQQLQLQAAQKAIIKPRSSPLSPNDAVAAVNSLRRWLKGVAEHIQATNAVALSDVILNMQTIMQAANTQASPQVNSRPASAAEPTPTALTQHALSTSGTFASATKRTPVYNSRFTIRHAPDVEFVNNEWRRRPFVPGVTDETVDAVDSIPIESAAPLPDTVHRQMPPVPLQLSQVPSTADKQNESKSNNDDGELRLSGRVVPVPFTSDNAKMVNGIWVPASGKAFDDETVTELSHIPDFTDDNISSGYVSTNINSSLTSSMQTPLSRTTHPIIAAELAERMGHLADDQSLSTATSTTSSITHSRQPSYHETFTLSSYAPPTNLLGVTEQTDHELDGFGDDEDLPAPITAINDHRTMHKREHSNSINLRRTEIDDDDLRDIEAVTATTDADIPHTQPTLTHFNQTDKSATLDAEDLSAFDDESDADTTTATPSRIVPPVIDRAAVALAELKMTAQFKERIMQQAQCLSSAAHRRLNQQDEFSQRAPLQADEMSAVRSLLKDSAEWNTLTAKIRSFVLQQDVSDEEEGREKENVAEDENDDIPLKHDDLDDMNDDDQDDNLSLKPRHVIDDDDIKDADWDET